MTNRRRTQLVVGLMDSPKNSVKVIRVGTENLEVPVIRSATDIIRGGGAVVYPTDTLYALGTNALDEEATLRIFKIKNRPLDRPLPIAVSGMKMTKKLAFVDDEARQLIGAFWPGALTLILPVKSIVPSVVVGGGSTVGLRMPNHPIPLAIMRMCGLPIVVTSANKHGHSSPLDVTEALRQLGSEVDLFLDCGTGGGQPSTIIDLTQTPPQMLRRGPITREMVEEIIGHVEN